MTARRIDTQAIHAGQEIPDPSFGARAVPIYQTTSILGIKFDIWARCLLCVGRIMLIRAKSSLNRMLQVV